MKRFASLRTGFCIATLAASFAAISAHAQILNGGFETGDLSGWTINDPSNFTKIGTAVSLANSGSFYLNLGASPTTGSFSQSFATSAGQMYNVSFFLANDSDGTGTEFLNIFFDGVPVANFTTTNFAFDPNFGPYTKVTLNGLLATTSSTTLEFQHRNDQGYWRLDDITASAVPEPSTISIAVFGLMLLGAGMYRRARA